MGVEENEQEINKLVNRVRELTLTTENLAGLLKTLEARVNKPTKRERISSWVKGGMRLTIPKFLKKMGAKIPPVVVRF